MENKSEPEERRTTSSLFPLFPAGAEVSGTSSTLQWLSNTSFTTDLSVVAQAVREHEEEEEEEEEKEEERGGEEQQNEDYEAKSSRSYHFVEESVEGDEKFSDSDRDTMKEKREEKNKTKRSKRKRSREGDSEFSDFGSGKSNVRARVDSLTKPAKDYYFDTHPDPDTLAFGSLYRMDIPRYKSCNPKKSPGFDSFWFYRWNQKGPALDQDGDASALDNKTKSGGRYWSAKYAALERHKDLKRIHHIAPRKSAAMSLDDFIPLSDEGADNCSISKHSVVEESWEDEVLRKTRDFNKLTREHPCDEKVWLAFAEFQDKVASMQTKKGARFQILEKKISILEKAVEINPDNEELLLCLLKAYRNRDSPDILIGRWQKILMQHSGNYKLWQEFLHVVQGEFSRFKVSDVRKMYSHAIQALSAACGKQSRQVHQSVKSSDPDVSQLELGLVHIFISLCRFEWQAGYHELATALFQAEIEFSLFCPSLLLTESSKQRLFEHFWNSNGARVGEEGAIGWSTWLEKEEENRQKVMKEAASHNNEVGGWSGWSEPLSKSIEAKLNPGEIPKSDVTGQDVEEEIENENVEQEEDTEALLKMLGIDVGADVSGEVNDTSTWARWSEEESSRDCCQWMPLRTNTGRSLVN
ncbi:protein NRDE2 homolog isoform X2 [Carica papaya]|uniref:protein NRDE2 homolog isoform X2 n=1 Tax=Carica papaya TaxID=3649 RepID=UPI000B8C779D|nr:protein NRDE2 homolog isoform X2 [Carica papaya]